MKNQHKLGNQTYQNLTSSEKQNKRKDKFLENYNKKLKTSSSRKESRVNTRQEKK